MKFKDALEERELRKNDEITGQDKDNAAAVNSASSKSGATGRDTSKNDEKTGQDKENKKAIAAASKKGAKGARDTKTNNEKGGEGSGKDGKGDVPKNTSTVYVKDSSYEAK